MFVSYIVIRGKCKLPFAKKSDINDPMPYVKEGGLKELALRGKDAESIKVVVHPHHTSLGRMKKDKRHHNNQFPKKKE